jgi:adenylate kinase
MFNQKVVIYIGPQGSGKGTQAKLLQQFLQEHDPDREILSIDTGQNFRQIMSGQGYSAGKIRESINRGDLQPDWMPAWLFVNSFVDNYEPGMHIIVDGIPRTLEQAKRVDEVLDYYGLDSVNVIKLDIDQDQTIARLINRGRVDDNETAIKHRLSQYREQTLPVIQYFKNSERYQVSTIAGGQHIEKVTTDIFKVLNLSDDAS